MIRDQIVALLRDAASQAQQSGELPAIAGPDIALERPQNPDHGDYASSLPLRLARAARMSPVDIAKRIVAHFGTVPYLASVEVAPPGFINFRLSDTWLAQQAQTIVQLGPRFGMVNLGQGRRVQIEFGSANPTGPLTVATGRGGALGDALARILTAAGFSVSTEYYVNDAGSRMDVFFDTVYARCAQARGVQAEVPADGYNGAYVVDLARDILDGGCSFLDLPRAEAAEKLGALALQKMVDSAREDLAKLGIFFDVWFSEQSLYEKGRVAAVISELSSRGHIAVRDGATWLTTSALGEEKDNVLIRSNGVPTYFASDIAYHYDKLVTRGFDWVINIWGADHQGHVPRMKAALSALEIDPARLTVIVHQMITLRRGSEVVRMSKRTGDLISLNEVVEEVGADAARFFFLARSAESQMDFDLELAKKQSEDNPVYYVQYAHARIASILRYAGSATTEGANLSLLRHEAELALVRKMLMLPELVATAAQKLEPHHLPYFAQDLAAAFHSFYTQCRVVSEDEELTRARLTLAQAAKITLANALELMGISAPEQM